MARKSATNEAGQEAVPAAGTRVERSAGRSAGRTAAGARRAGTRTVVRWVGLAVTGVAVVGATGAVAAVGLPWAQALTGGGPAAEPGAARTVAVDPAPATLVCPQPARLPEGSDVGDDQFQAAPVRTTSTYALAVVGSLAQAPRVSALDGGGERDLVRGAAGSATADETSGGVLLRARPDAEGPFRAAGALASVTTAGDLRGLAAGACTAPAISQWVVGGSTEVGSSAMLVVQNPSERAATVTLTVHGPSGQVALGSNGSFVLGPGESRETRLEAAAPDQRRLAVHVTSSGARVNAHLQAQSIDGLVPQGVDLLTPGAEPRRTVAVPGIVSGGQAVDDPHAPQLRMLVPGEEPTTARVSVYGPEGRVYLRGGEEVDLEPGVVTDLPIGGLPEGSYTVVVDADRPLVAAAVSAREGVPAADAVVSGAPYDVAWVAGAAVPEAAGSAQAALPAGARPVLALTAVPADRGEDADPSGRTAAVVRLYGADGARVAEREVTLEVARSTTVDLAGLADGATPAAVGVEADGAGVVWSVQLSADDGTSAAGTLVASLPATATEAAPGSVSVREVDAVG
ncbi:DUF5719 family protein [Puerhibacterium sp. TATVAM-FAB25]|uniref:DUF5719 family protein n=1 Tax=Puerhibacterium sp. TATVAM-FAB25 TaxID=3093699 RepID=UPI0039788907